MLLAGETGSMTGSSYAVATSSPSGDLTFTSANLWRQRGNLNCGTGRLAW